MEETAVDPKACSHMDGETSLLKPHADRPSKVVCTACGQHWRPVRGEVWIHKDEIEAAVEMAAAIK
jgi:hypothetical protein